MFKKLFGYMTASVCIYLFSNNADCTDDLIEKHKEFIEQSKLFKCLLTKDQNTFLENYDKAPPIYYDADNDLYYSREAERPTEVSNTQPPCIDTSKNNNDSNHKDS